MDPLMQASDSQLNIEADIRPPNPPRTLAIGSNKSSCSDSKLALDYFQSVDEMTDPPSEESDLITKKSRARVLRTESGTGDVDDSLEDDTLGTKKVRIPLKAFYSI